MWSLNDEKDIEDDADGIDANEAEAAAAEPKKNRLRPSDAILDSIVSVDSPLSIPPDDDDDDDDTTLSRPLPLFAVLEALPPVPIPPPA